MNANEFYEEFKAALKYLGLTWGLMELATIKIDGEYIVMDYADKRVTFKVP